MNDRQGRINVLKKADVIKTYSDVDYTEITATIKINNFPHGNVYIYIDEGTESSCPLCGNKLVGGK